MPRPSPRHAQDPVLVAFGQAVRRARAEFGISQEELAHRAAIDRSYMSSIERGGQNVGLISAVRIAKAMETSLSDLVLMAKV